MPRVNPRIRTAKGMIADGILGYVRYARAIARHRKGTVAAELRKRYPNASDAEIDKVIEYHDASRDVARKYTRGSDKYKASDEAIPCRETGTQPYRYVVNVIITDPGTRTERRDNQIIDSQTSLTKAEILEQAIEKTKGLFRSKSRGKMKYRGGLAANVTYDIEVLFVERLC